MTRRIASSIIPSAIVLALVLAAAGCSDDAAPRSTVTVETESMYPLLRTRSVWGIPGSTGKISAGRVPSEVIPWYTVSRNTWALSGSDETSSCVRTGYEYWAATTDGSRSKRMANKPVDSLERVIYPGEVSGIYQGIPIPIRSA